ncbi:MAG: nucleotidyltransferase [Chthonomonadales bacterium]
MPNTDNDLLRAAADVLSALEGFGLSPTIIGGVAVSLMTQSRHTDDVDVQILFDTNDATSLLETLAQKGFQPRFSDMEELAKRSRMITVRHKATDTVIDIALGCMPFEAEIQARASTHNVGNYKIRLPSPEDLTILKAIASRPKDLEDIRNIGLVYPNMDRTRIEHWVREYGDLLDEPDLWERTRDLLDGKS